MCKPGVRVEVSAFPWFLKLPLCHKATGSPVPHGGLNAGLGIERMESPRRSVQSPGSPSISSASGFRARLSWTLSLRNAREGNTVKLAVPPVGPALLL